jgi:hypothetical protein
MEKARKILDITIMSAIYSLIVVLVNLVVIFLFTQDIIQILYWLSFITLIEGGLGLIAGGGSVLYSPIFNKAFEKIFHSEPWDFKRQKKTEQQALKWIITGSLLIAEALIFSAI